MRRTGTFLLIPSDVTNFRDNFCTARGCGSEEFASEIFWRCRHRHAVALAPVVMVLQPDYFSPDRDLIAHLGRVWTMRELDAELRDFMHDARNQPWWRMRGRVRLSTQRLRRIARPHLAAAPAAPR